MKIAIYSTQQFEINSLKNANQDRHELHFFTEKLTTETAHLAANSDAVCIFTNDDASAAVLQMLAHQGIRYLALRCAGYNQTDLARAEALNIAVANVPAYSPYAVAEHSVALILALNRKIVKAQRRIRELDFTLDGLTGFDLHGKTVGIVGMGRIGQAFAKIMHGFGCNLLAFDQYPNEKWTEKYGVQYVAIDELCEQSDIISLHVPLLDSTYHIINAERLAMMKPTAMLINTSRGALLDTPAVIDALKAQRLGYLGIDVYEQEDGLFFHDHSEDILQDDQLARLLVFPNVLVTGHQGFLTETALRNIADTTFENLQAWERGETAKNDLRGVRND